MLLLMVVPALIREPSPMMAFVTVTSGDRGGKPRRADSQQQVHLASYSGAMGQLDRFLQQTRPTSLQK